MSALRRRRSEAMLKMEHCGSRVLDSWLAKPGWMEQSPNRLGAKGVADVQENPHADRFERSGDDSEGDCCSSGNREERKVAASPCQCAAADAFGLFGLCTGGLDAQRHEKVGIELATAAEGIDYPKELVSTALRFGAIYSEVLAEAEAWGADLIVVGSHRPSMSTYLLGSNANTIVRHAKCAVLVARN